MMLPKNTTLNDAMRLWTLALTSCVYDGRTVNILILPY